MLEATQTPQLDDQLPTVEPSTDEEIALAMNQLALATKRTAMGVPGTTNVNWIRTQRPSGDIQYGFPQ